MSMDDFGYSQCDCCHGEHLTFTIRDGLCPWCWDVVQGEREGE